MKFTIGLEEREWISQNAIKEVGNETRKFRVVDMDKLKAHFRAERYKTGLAATLSILPIKEDMKKDRNYTFSNFNDRQHDVIHGVFIGLDKNGEPKFKRFDLKGSQDFDLTRPDDLEFWLIARWHPQLKGSPNESGPYYKVYDATEEILSSTEKMTSMLTAAGRIKGMKLKEKIYFLRYLQIPILNSYTEQIIDGLLFQFAQNSPSTFNEKYSSAQRSLYEIFYTAITLGVIQHVPDYGYKFENFKLGAVEFDVIAALNKDKTVLSSVLDKIAKLDLSVSDIETKTKRLELLKSNPAGPIEEKITVENPDIDENASGNGKNTNNDNQWT